MNVLIRKARTLARDPKRAIRGKFKRLIHHKSQRYMNTHGLWDVLVSGQEGEHAIDPIDQANLHYIIRRYRPLQVLEFGIGFSTITMAHALWMNDQENLRNKLPDADEQRGHLWTVDTSEEWIGNTDAKMPDNLRPYVDLRHSTAEALELNGQLCHRYTKIPNIAPDMIYLDGPSPYEVSGEVSGLVFLQETGANRSVISADPVLLEPGFGTGFRMVVDGRYNNVHFLKKNLRRDYAVRTNYATRITTFVLKERS